VIDAATDVVVSTIPLSSFHGFKLCVFTEGLAALKHFSLNSKSHAMIISDIKMPNISDNEFVKQVKKINPKVKLIPTGNEEQLPPSDTSAHVDAFIKKPFSLETLRNIVQGYYQQEMT
jgi:DNA-binding NtrC family response regulator